MPARSEPSPAMPVTSDPEANELLVDDPLALLLGMLLDQQVRSPGARGPSRP